MDEQDRIKVSKDTQKFVMDLADLAPDKCKKVIAVLDALRSQQGAEADMEHKRGWRYMWQRTPKPYLLMLGYLVFLAPVGGFGYNALQYVGEEHKIIFLITLSAILLLPLIVVFYLSYHYVKQGKTEEDRLQTHEESNEAITHALKEQETNPAER